MFTLRCTRTLLKRLRAQPNASPPPPTTRLGDWYGNLLYTRPQQLVICVSERSLLPVVVPSRGSAPTRQILGSMNDFASILETYLAHGDSLIEASLRLAKAPCSPIQMRSPNEVASELLGRG